MAKSWSSEEIAIKNALKKSGTDLVAFEALRKQEKEPPQSSSMVYYQAAPLIMKTKHVGAERFCSPGQQNYSLNNCNSLSMQRQLTPTANNAISATVTSSINSAQQQQQQQQQYQHLHVKNEPLQQPDVTRLQQQQQQQQHMIISPTTNTNNMTIKAVYNNNNTQSNFNPYNNVSASINVTQPVKGSRSMTTMAEMRNKPQFKCDYCGMTFGSKSAHTSHTKSHTKNGELGITSVINNREMQERSGITGCIPKQPEIKVNLNAVNTGSDPYQCNVCQKTFAVPARLIRHYRTHTGERPFECEFCHKLFSVKENLQVHRRIHTKERPYKCDVCGRAFEHSGKLHRHMRIHTGERPHKCETCGKTFIQSGQLVIHIRTHTGEKPYKCPVQGCKKDFTCSKQLKVHSRIHTGEKPYQCEFCHKCFGYNHVLKLHRRSHLATKCFQCNICEVTLISKKAIEAHIKGHANTIPVNVEEGGDVTKATTTTMKATSSSSSASSGVESISSPNSPQSLAQKTKTDNFPNHYTTRSISPLSPGSATASISSSTSSYHSLSPHSISSPYSPTTSPNLDNNQRYSYDQHTPTVQTYQKAALTTTSNTSLRELKSPLIYRTASEEEMPTDLRITPITTESQTTHIFDYQSYPDQNIQYYYFNPTAATLQSPAQFITPTDRTHITKIDEPTINPALLEAACMASRREVTLDDVEQAAIQIMQLHQNQRKSYTEVTPTLPPSASTTSATSTCVPLFLNEMTTFDYGDDDGSAHVDELQPYKNTELIKQPLNKGCAPVPKFQSSLQNNDIILRQVEAAIAPLRLSSDSPERSSSPDSDCDRFLLMADRDVMTLPLRKRKLYMSQPKKQDDNDTIKAKVVPTKTASASAPTTTITTDNDKDTDPNNKVMRHNSVIQFAKAS